MNDQMKALLGVLAVAGFQNRDKIREVLTNLTQGHPATAETSAEAAQGSQAGGLGGMLGGLLGGGGFGGLLGGNSAGGILSAGLGGLFDHFTQNGQGDTVNSWVSKGENKPIDDEALSQALGPEVLQELGEKTGLSQQELLQRLSRDLPKAVNELTPEGKVPEASSFA